jgi:hypothetical protein
MASVKTKLYKGKKLADGSHPIVIQVIHNQQRKIVSTGYHALPEQWDDARNEPNRNYPNVARLKNLLRKKLAEAEKELIDLDAEGIPYTIEDVIEKIGGKTENLNITDFIDRIAKRMVKEGREGNSKAYTSTMAILKLYHGDTKRTLRDINYQYVKKFESFLFARGVKVNTVAFYMRTLRSVYNIAEKEGFVKKKANPFHEYKIQREATQKRAISKEDIHKIRDLELSDEAFPFLGQC